MVPTFCLSTVDFIVFPDRWKGVNVQTWPELAHIPIREYTY